MEWYIEVKWVVGKKTKTHRPKIKEKGRVIPASQSELAIIKEMFFSFLHRIAPLYASLKYIIFAFLSNEY